MALGPRSSPRRSLKGDYGRTARVKRPDDSDDPSVILLRNGRDSLLQSDRLYELLLRNQ
jgi:hypothetical protein